MTYVTVESKYVPANGDETFYVEVPYELVRNTAPLPSHYPVEGFIRDSRRVFKVHQIGTSSANTYGVHSYVYFEVLYVVTCRSHCIDPFFWDTPFNAEWMRDLYLMDTA